MVSTLGEKSEKVSLYINANNLPNLYEKKDVFLENKFQTL